MDKIKVCLALGVLCGSFGISFAGDGPGGIGTTDGSSSLILWLNPSAGTTVDGSNNLTAWADQSGNGNNASTTASSEPLLVSNVKNGFPVVRFDSGNSEFMNLGNATSGDLNINPSTTDLSIIAVTDNSTTGTGVLIGKSASSSSSTQYEFAFSGTTSISLNGGGNSNSFTVGTSGFHIFSFTIKDTTFSTRPLTLITDGTDTFPAVGVLTGSTTNSQNVNIGRNTQGANNFFDGDLAELIVYNSLNTVEAQIGINYLSAKYDISISGFYSDKYAGDTNGNGDFDFDVAGIGRDVNGTHASSESAGLIVTNQGFLSADDTYLIFGHKETSNTQTTSGISGGVEARFLRSWYFDLTGTGSGDIDIVFDFAKAGITGSPTGSSYVLLTSSDDGVNFTTVAGVTDNVSGTEVQFNGVASTSLVDGNVYTLGTTDLNDSSLPVTLTEFSASEKSGKVVLNWTTASELNNLGFILNRSTDSKNFVEIASHRNFSELRGFGSTPSEKFYTFVDDSEFSQGQTYTYKIQSQDFDGQIHDYDKFAKITFDGKIELNYKLEQNFPNPFNPKTVINYQLPTNSEGKLVIFNVLGEEIREFELTENEGFIVWDGKNTEGSLVSSGTYFYKINSEKFSETKRMTLVK